MGDNMKSTRRENIRHFENKKREDLKGNVNELGTRSKNKKYIEEYIDLRGIANLELACLQIPTF
jgi:hypothetical protein